MEHNRLTLPYMHVILTVHAEILLSHSPMMAVLSSVRLVSNQLPYIARLLFMNTVVMFTKMMFKSCMIVYNQIQSPIHTSNKQFTIMTIIKTVSRLAIVKDSPPKILIIFESYKLYFWG